VSRPSPRDGATVWDERYAAAEHVYGTEPNDFLAEHAHERVGPVLSLAEGEGRNGVYLATLGLELPGLEPILLHERVRDVREGKFHGRASAVVQFLGRKRG
jgi:hypothetical protein